MLIARSLIFGTGAQREPAPPSLLLLVCYSVPWVSAILWETTLVRSSLTLFCRASFLRFAQYAFILLDCALRAAADMPPRRLFVTVGILASTLLGGRPLRFVGP